MANPFSEARKRQLARFAGAKPPVARAAIALAKSQAYEDTADVPTTLRTYATDLANYKARCDKHGFVAMPATPEVVGLIWPPPARAARCQLYAAGPAPARLQIARDRNSTADKTLTLEAGEARDQGAFVAPT